MNNREDSTATITEESHRQNVQAALRKAHIPRAVDKLLDGALPQSKAMTLACMKLMLVNNNAGDEIMRRCEAETEHLRDYIGGRPTDEPEIDVACAWLTVLDGIRCGHYEPL